MCTFLLCKDRIHLPSLNKTRNGFPNHSFLKEIPLLNVISVQTEAPHRGGGVLVASSHLGAHVLAHYNTHPPAHLILHASN